MSQGVRISLLVVGVLFVVIGFALYPAKRPSAINPPTPSRSPRKKPIPPPILSLGDDQQGAWYLLTYPIGEWIDTKFPVGATDSIKINGGPCEFLVKVNGHVYSGKDNIPVSIVLKCKDGCSRDKQYCHGNLVPLDFSDTIKIKFISAIPEYFVGQVRLIKSVVWCPAIGEGWGYNYVHRGEHDVQSERRNKIIKSISVEAKSWLQSQ